MAILKIAHMGHPVLRRPAESVDDPTTKEMARLVADMLETMADAGGVGLAAPQVHVGRRVVAFHVPKARAGDPQAQPASGDGPVPLTILINPQIELLDEAMEDGWEACLSLPELTGLVPRYRHIRYRGYDLRGRMIDRVAEGFHARVVQHECDHLDGILYPQRLSDLSALAFVEELARHPPWPSPTGSGAGDPGAEPEST
jgi:peptide deformylase